MLYKEALGRKSAYVFEETDNEWLIMGHLMMDADVGNCADLRNRLESAERQLNEVYWSFSYRIALMLMKMPIPFRKQMKQMLRMLRGRWRNL